MAGSRGVKTMMVRHSFAMSLRRSGVVLMYLQEILEHKSLKTTEIYTHVTKKKLSTIKNPLDSILKGVKHEDKNKEQWSSRGKYMRTVRISSKFRCISEQFGYERVRRNPGVLLEKLKLFKQFNLKQQS